MRRFAKLGPEHIDEITQMLRLGLGILFIVLSWNTFQASLLSSLTPAFVWNFLSLYGFQADALTSILFEGAAGFSITPEMFLSIIATAQALGGLLLLFGLGTRPISALFGLALFIPWALMFFEALPWVFREFNITPFETSIYTLENAGLAFLLLVLVNLGSGGNSLDNKLGLRWNHPLGVIWDSVGLELRFGIALTFFAGALGGYFFGAETLTVPWYLFGSIGVIVFFGFIPRFSGLACIGLIGWQLVAMLGGAANGGAALTFFAGQAPILAAAVIYSLAGGGERLRPNIRLTQTVWGRVKR